MGDIKIMRLRGDKVAYFSSLRLPEGKSGDFEIKHCIEKAGKVLDIVTARDSFFWSLMGKAEPERRGKLGEVVCIHKLLEHGGVWMSDCPQEIYSQRWQIERFKGEVLVGGLGLGWAVTELEANPDVKVITVIEKSPDVINLVWKHLKLKKTELIQVDLYKFLKEAKRLGLYWDYGYYDIWCPTGERVLQEHILPLRKLSDGIIKHENLECWQELTMLGQILNGLQTAVMTTQLPAPMMTWLTMPEETFQKNRKWFTESYAFYNWFRRTKPTYDEAMAMIEPYAKTYTNQKVWRKTWERWDK
jgi:hypothetical protein